jgi:cytochrome c oxidase subunit II
MTAKFFPVLLLLALCLAAPAFAAPVDWQLGFQEAASPVAERFHEFHNFLLWIITAITIFVLGLLIYIVLRFNKRANPVPAKFTHNVLIEVIWTAVPVLILIVIIVPSFKLLYYTDRVENPEMTLKVTGNQWNWTYEYPDHESLSFVSYMIPTPELKEGQLRLLSTDNAVVLPVDTTIAVQVTASDVLHSWAVPALGVKVDAVPGRLNESWVRITKPGVYYGQCSELCGKDHAFMPIEIHAVPKEEFDVWLVKAKEEFSALDAASYTKLAYLEGNY